MIAVNGWSLWLAEVSLVYWFVYFQYYWFPQLRPQPFTGFCFLMGLIYACLDRVLLNLPPDGLVERITRCRLTGDRVGMPRT
ncbi:hypothetical protein LNA02_19900 [Levilactobacillus namurensis]|nr:hypothetical protein LNA02_19900 [Levilactobacillus namurensis]